jgi:hypothetical protein
MRLLSLNKLFYIFIFISFSAAQIDYTISHELKYGDGKELLNGQYVPYNYFENLLDINLSYSRFNLYEQWEYSDPPQFGYPLQKLNKAYLEYVDDNLMVKLGDIYTLYGRGLGLNLFQDQSLDFDNSLRGVEFSYSKNEGMKFFGLGGKGLFEYKSSPSSRYNNKSIYNSITAFGAEIWLPWISSNVLVFNINQDIETLLVGGDIENKHVDIDNFGLNGIWGPVEFFFEKSWLDWTIEGILDDFDNPINHKGDFLYTALSFDLFGFGITHEYKDYDAEDFLLSISNPPIVFRESASTLVSRSLHIINFTDEVGHQIEIMKRIGENYNLLFNYSLSHRNNGFSQKVFRAVDYVVIPFVGDTILTDSTVETKNNLSSSMDILKFDQNSFSFFPYNQFYIELDGYLFNDKLNFKLGYDWKNEIISYSNKRSYDYSMVSNEIQHLTDTTLQFNNTYEYQKVLTLPNQFSYNFGNGSSLSSYFEFQWISNNFNRDKVYLDSVDVSLTYTDEVYNRYFTLSYRHPSKWTITAIYDYSSFDPTNPDGFNTNPDDDNFLEHGLRQLGIDIKNKWFGVEFLKDFSNNHQFSVFYGSEVGGLRCANGVCAYQPPFMDGFKIAFRSIF